MTAGDLKNFRAPRRGPWPLILAGSFALAFTCVIGPMDYADRLNIKAENTVLRVELAKLRKPEKAQMEPGRIWVRCRDPKREYHARQADGGKWTGACWNGFITVSKGQQ